MSEENNAKKLCVPSATKAQPDIAASPPRFVSLEELMSAAKGITQMSLAHEIAVNKDFKLEKKEPSNSLEKIIKETMHKAFWDVLDSELKESPPRYAQALLLLEEVKNSLQELLLPQHSRLHQRIDQVLDMELIRQQAERGILHEQYLEYAQFVISIMGKLCAPIRDDKIGELTQTKEVIPLFRGILDTLNLMKIDMANFTIDIMRPTIVANSVAYEKQKFNDFLKVHPDGLSKTIDWLKNHLDSANDDSVDLSKRIDAVINKAYLDLVQWHPGAPLPETLTMDASRIAANTQELRRITRAGAVLILVFSHAGPNLASIATWKETVKNHVLTLIDDMATQDLTSVGVKMVADINEGAAKYNVTGHSSVGLEEVIKTVDLPDHRVFNLLSESILQADSEVTALAKSTLLSES